MSDMDVIYEAFPELDPDNDAFHTAAGHKVAGSREISKVYGSSGRVIRVCSVDVCECGHTLYGWRKQGNTINCG